MEALDERSTRQAERALDVPETGSREQWTQRADLRCTDADGSAQYEGRRGGSGAPINRMRPYNRRGEAASAPNQERGRHGQGVLEDLSGCVACAEQVVVGR